MKKLKKLLLWSLVAIWLGPHLYQSTMASEPLEPAFVGPVEPFQRPTGVVVSGVTSGGVVVALQVNTDGTVVTSAIASGAIIQGAGLATSAGQDTGNSSLSSIVTNTTGAATAANQTTGNSTLSTIATNTTGAATAANQATGNTTLSTIATNQTAGPAAASGSQPVVPVAAPSAGTFISINLTTGGTAQQMAASSATRKGFIIFNPISAGAEEIGTAENICVTWDGSNPEDDCSGPNDVELSPGGSVAIPFGNSPVPTGAIKVNAATSNHRIFGQVW